jgi:hypothetical protein
MIHRRSFLANVLGSAAAAHSVANFGDSEPDTSLGQWQSQVDLARVRYEELFRASQQLWSQMGVPNSWSIVKEAFHPVAPQRVVTMTAQSVQDVWAQVDGGNSLGCAIRAEVSRWPGGSLAEEKVHACVAIVTAMATHYCVPERIGPWAIALCQREALAATAICPGFGLAHQFQRPLRERTRLDTPPVEWWLFLFPQGLNWGSYDENPVYCVTSAISTRPRAEHELCVWCRLSAFVGHFVDHRSDPGQDSVGSFDERWARRRATTRRLAGLDPATAARLFNIRGSECLNG